MGLKDRALRHLRSEGFRKIYNRLLLLFSVTVLAPIIILGNWFSYTWMSGQREAFHESSLQEIKRVAYNIQHNFSIIENEILQLKNDRNFYYYERVSEPSDSIEPLWLIAKRLDETKTKFSIVKSVYFYDLDSESIVVSGKGVYSMADYYDKSWVDLLSPAFQVQYLDVRTDMDADILSDPQQKRMYFHTPEKVLTIAIRGTKSQVFAINISVSALYQYLNDVFSFSPYSFYLLNENNIISLCAESGEIGAPFQEDLTEIGSEFWEAGGQYFYTNRINDATVSVFTCPKSVAADMIRPFQRYLFWICFFLVAALILLLVFISKKIYRPVDDFMGQIRQFAANSHIEQKGDISYLKSVYDDLNQKNQTMQSSLDFYQNTMRITVFRNYLDGLIDEPAMRERIQDASLFQGAGCLILFAFDRESFENMKNISAVRVNLLETVDTYISSVSDGLFFEVHSGRFLAFLSAETETALQSFRENLIYLFLSLAGQRVTTVYMEVRGDIKGSYEAAARALQHMVYFQTSENPTDASGLVSQMGTAEPGYSFVINYETALIRAVINESGEDCRQCLRELQDSILKSPCQPDAIRLFHRLLTTLEKEFQIEPMEGNRLFEELSRQQTLKGTAAFFERLTDRLIERAALKKGSPYCDQAKAYIESNYMRDLGITEVADALGISYPYLSKLFKDHVGASLLDYLGKVRIEKSKELLTGTEDTLPVIAQKVGYNNVQSFQRFFKKLEQITPGEYRRLHQR